MRTCLLPALLLAAMIAGCSSTIPETPVVLERIGPRVAGPKSGRQGYLRVYSAARDVQSGKMPYRVHTPYWVFDDSGRPVRSVVNHVGDTDQAPMLVVMLPGEYRIVAEAAGYGQITVPVVIASGRLTEVHLDLQGNAYFEAVPESEVVRLPQGERAGYRARTPPKPRTPSEDASLPPGTSP